MEGKHSNKMMSNSSTKVMTNMNTIIDDLTCSICLDYYSDPRILDCHHSFCSKCLKRNKTTANQSNRINKISNIY